MRTNIKCYISVPFMDSIIWKNVSFAIYILSQHGKPVGSLTAPRYLVWTWARFTVDVECCIFSSYSCRFPPGSQDWLCWIAPRFKSVCTWCPVIVKAGTKDYDDNRSESNVSRNSTMSFVDNITPVDSLILMIHIWYFKDVVVCFRQSPIFFFLLCL